MITLTMTDMGKNSPKCPPGCQKYNPSGCSCCTSRFRTIFRCDYCNTIGAFFGGQDPKECSSCKRPFPDLYLLKAARNKTVRVKYHLGVMA